MDKKESRGSQKLMAAWKARVLTEASVKEIATGLEESRAKVEAVQFLGGSSSVGVNVSLSYAGDDVGWCGNDMQFWLRWMLKHGGRPRPPRIIINGTPFPDFVQMELLFGQDAADLSQAGHLAEPLKGIVVTEG